MKHAWILNHYAQEPNGAGGTRHFSLAKRLQTHGWTATIVAASVDFNTGLQRLNRGEKLRLQNIDGVDFLWLRVPEYKGNGGGRLANMLAYSLRAWLPKSTRMLARPDVVVGSSVHPFAALVGALLARRFDVPFVFEVRDLWPQTLIDMGRLKSGSVVARCMGWLEKWLYQRASRIVMLLPHAADYTDSLDVPRSKVVWISNGVDLSEFAPPPPASNAEHFTLMYFGAHGQANGLEPLILAMLKVQEQWPGNNIRLRMIGDGPKKQELQTLASKLELGCISFEPAVPKKLIPATASAADAFVITVRDLPKLYRFGISMNKLYDYLAASRPIIIASAASNNPVADAGAGLTVLPDDPAALAEGICRLARMSLEDRNEMGRKARDYVERNHGYDQLAARFADTLNAAQGHAP